MPNIKPISDLRNYSEVLRDVAVGAPVFLTKNGRGRYAIVDMQDYEKTQATLKLMNELAKGRRSGEEDGWLTSEEIENSTPTLEQYVSCKSVSEIKIYGSPLLVAIAAIVFRTIICYNETNQVS